MESTEVSRKSPTVNESRLALVVFLLCLGFHSWGISVGWQNKHLPGSEFRQAQTALSIYWIDAENDFSLAYPTPVLGKPWSIPMEFPLYQWTAVVISKATHWNITKAGRAVSIGCFYLSLPAVFLLLRRWGVHSGRRWWVLSVIVTCPLYIFYTRGIFIETMALMFSLWFWVAYERSVEQRSKKWLVLAIFAGTGAGLVKVTTYMLYLLPTGFWSVKRLWAERRGEWKVDLGWMAAIVALPFMAAIWWVGFADSIKEMNVLGSAFTSTGLRDFNLGTLETRFSGALWATKLGIIWKQLTWYPVFIACALFLLIGGRARWREISNCVIFFASVLLIFPALYAYHDYYYVANTLLLLIAMGLVLVALAETRVARGLFFLLACLIICAQGWYYLEHYYPRQNHISSGDNGLTQSLRAVTRPEEVVVVLGQDWNSKTPFFAQRRAMMIRDDIVQDIDRVARAFAALDGHRIGALVIDSQPPGSEGLIELATTYGLASEPLYIWGQAEVFLPPERRVEQIDTLLNHYFHDVRLAPGVKPSQDHLSDRWLELANLRQWERGAFEAMDPAPVRFYAKYGPSADGSSGQLMFGAHPVTRLVFSLPAGEHTLRSSLQMPVDAYREDLAESDVSDGVEVSLFILSADGGRKQVATRHFDPRHKRNDRGRHRPLEFGFKMPVAGEIELFFGPGSAGRETRDWIQMGPLRID